MRCVIRTDASFEIGTGHVIRCLTLADELQRRGGRVSFICRRLKGDLCDYIEAAGYPVVPIGEETTPLPAGGEQDATATAAVLESVRPDWLIVDHYAIGRDWEFRLASPARKLMVIDDLADRPHSCDLLLDQNYYDDYQSRYQQLVPESCVQLLGPDFVLLREEFSHLREERPARDGIIRKVLVFYGGSDPTNETEKALSALSMLDAAGSMEIDVVVGNSNPRKERIARLCSAMPSTRFHCQTQEMARLMAVADLSIGASGSASWERFCLGLPSIVTITADNQIELGTFLATQQMVVLLGRHDAVTRDAIKDALENMLRHPELVLALRTATANLIDGLGARRVADMLIPVN